MELINVGYISGFHGVKGEVKIKATTDFPEERFAVGNKLLVTDEKETVELTISQHRVHKNINMLRFAEIDNLNEIEKYKGYALKIEADTLLDLDDDEYYHFELIGLSVFDYQGNLLGEVVSVMNTDANDNLVVKSGKKEILIPFIKDVINEVNLEAKKITLFEVEGLF